MTTIYITYAGDAQTRFDRSHYVSVHLPLVLRAWRKYGLDSAAAFFPSGDGAGTVAICECRFRDDAAAEAAFSSPEISEVMDDVPRFTDVAPVRSRVVPL